MAAAKPDPRQISLISPPPPLPSPPLPPAPPGTYFAPGLDFSLLIPGYTLFTFGPAQQALLCNALTSGWAAAGTGNSQPACNIGSITTFDTSQVLVNGIAYYTWPNTTVPTSQQLSIAAALRDARVSALTTSINTVLGTSFPGTIPNCGCNGLTPVTQNNNIPFIYGTQLPGIVGPMVCGARLLYTETIADPNAYMNVVGIDDGTQIPANLGKFCSAAPIAVSVGVFGNPSFAGPCRQYGVLTSGSSSVTATAVASVTAGVISSIGMTNVGSGYYGQPPTVLISSPDPSVATVTATVSGTGALTIAPNAASNGPYSGVVSIASFTGATCVDSTNTGSNPVGSICIGTPVSITVGSTLTGATCTAANLAPTGMPVSTAGALVTFAVDVKIKCQGTPTIVLATTNFVSSGTQAVATANIGTNGIITSLSIVNGGAGYRNPVIAIAPAASSVGKLCSPNPIQSLSSTLAYNVPTTISRSGVCQPLGIDSYAQAVCSSPAVTGGITGTVNVFTCNVQSVFLAQPTSTALPSTCAIVSQSFLTNINGAPTTPSPPPPPGTIPPSPPLPSPSPSPIPTPTPSPATRQCRYDGVYRIQSVACPGYYLAFSTGDCDNNNIALKTSAQAKSPRANWRLTVIAISGRSTPASAVVAEGRLESCKKSKNVNLGAVAGSPTPQLAGAGWKIRINPISFSKCANVRLQAASGNDNNGKYLSVDCKKKMFSWRSLSSSDTKQQWKLMFKSE